MRLSCDVHVVYSLLTSPATAKPVKATLALGIKPRVKTLLTTTTKTLGDVTLLLCTGKQTKKYEVSMLCHTMWKVDDCSNAGVAVFGFAFTG